MNIGEPLFYPYGPSAIRDGTVARLVALGIFKNVYRQRTMPTKDDQLPLAAVWTMRDDTTPNGDANVGPPSFFHQYTFVVDVLMAANSDDALTAGIDDLVFKVRAALLTDLTWVNLFEGIERCNVHPVYPKETALTFAQAAIEIEVTFRSEWPPYVPNDFLQVGVSTSKAGTTPPVLNGLSTQFDIPEPAPCPTPAP